MIGAGSIEYAHARIWARHAQRPDEAAWRRIESLRELSAVLDGARQGPLAVWLGDIVPDAGPHAIEAALRRQWRARVTELAGWMPPDWGPSVEWCAELAQLPAWQHAARGEAPWPWMRGDPQLAVPSALALDAASGEPAQLLARWIDEWQRRLPAGGGSARLQQELLPLLVAHARRFGSPQLLDGWALRRQLQQRLQGLLRRWLIEPATAFVYLALSALEFERLRGELLRRAAFPMRGAVP